MLVEIADLKEIAKAQGILRRTLARELRHRRERTIGYPSGHFRAEVFFARGSGDEITWWSGGRSRNRKDFYNFIGRGEPASDAPLMIDLQFNLPARKFTRSRGGAFVRDTETGELLLAHRGIVTRGKSRVRKDDLLSEAAVTSTTVESGTGTDEFELLIVAPIDRKGLSVEIRDFAEEVRRAADVVKNQRNRSGVTRTRRRSGNAWPISSANTSTSSRAGAKSRAEARQR